MMTEASVSYHGSAKRLMYTPHSSGRRCHSRTPHFTNPPLSRRVIASTRATRRKPEEEEEHDYAGLLKKTWKIYSLSPLYRFNSSKISLTKYERSLDVAFSQVKTQGWSTETSGNEKSSFSIYEGLNFHCNDAKAVQIQVIEKSDSGGRGNIALNAFLICVDLDSSPVPEHLSSSFTYYPVILISGNKARSDLLLNWLEQHFDCQTSLVCFSNNDLRWMLGMWSSQAVARKTFPVLLQYCLADVCDGISTIDCKFEAEFCTELWERLNGSASSRNAVNESEVNKFVTALEEHLEYTMHIMFSKLCLSEVGTSIAYVSSQGKLKVTCLLSSSYSPLPPPSSPPLPALRWLENTLYNHVVIVTDSQSMLTRVKTGMLRAEWHALIQKLQIVSIVGIFSPGHSGVVGNEQADRLAGAASLKSDLMHDRADVVKVLWEHVNSVEELKSVEELIDYYGLERLKRQRMTIVLLPYSFVVLSCVFVVLSCVFIVLSVYL